MGGTPTTAGPPATADRLARWIAALETFGDTSNPLTIRLLRQQSRSMIFTIVLHLLLLLGVTAAVVAATIPPEYFFGHRVSLLRSEMLFLLVVAAWSAVAWIAQPVTFIATVRNEREEATWELLDLTGLPPLRILAGLVWAATIQQFLLLAMMAPFLVMAWMMNGLDPLAILLAIIGIPLGGVVSVCVGVKATLGGKRGGLAGRPGRAAIGASLGWLLAMTVMWLFTIGRMPGMPNLRAVGEGACLTLLLMGNLALQFGAAALVDAAMRITHPAANRSTAPRVMTLVFVANLLLVMAGLMLIGQVTWQAAIAWTVLVTAIWNAFTSIEGFAEPFDLTRRQAAITSKHTGLRRLLDPGAAGARRFHLALALPALAGGIIVWLVGSRHDTGPIGAITVGAVAYGAIILMISDALARGGETTVSRPIFHRRWVWGFIVVGTVAGGIFGAVGGGSSVIASLSPLFGLGVFGMAGAGVWREDTPIAVMLVCFAGGFALISMIAQARRKPEIRALRGEPN